jgi:hypothetical protein
MNQEQAYINHLNWLSNEINYWIQIITVPLGILFNLTSLYIFSRPNLNQTNMGFFYLNITAWNTIALLFSFFLIDSKVVFGYDLSLMNDISCASVWFLRRFVRFVSPWLEVLITVDRYIFICHTNKFQFLKSKLYLSIIILTICVCLLLQSVPNLYYKIYITNEIKNLTNKTSLNVIRECKTTKEIALITDLIPLFVKVLIPMIVMVVLSVLLIRKVKEKKFKNNYKKSSNSNNSKELQFALTIIGMNAIFISINLPLSFMNSFRSVYNNLLSKQINSIIATTVINFLYSLSFQIANLYYSFMIFSYLIFNKLYLNEFLNLFKSIKITRNDQRSSSNLDSRTRDSSLK